MSKESYFGQYESPNIIIVPTPTVSFSPPGTETKADPIIITSSRTNCETVKHIIESPSGYNYCNKQDSNEFVTNTNMSSRYIEGASTLDNLTLKTQDIISTGAPSNNISQGIKLSSSTFKSRNNLVDLTGFNILKRDSGNKHKDFRQINHSKIEQDLMKTTVNKIHRESSETYKTDNKSSKESSKNVKPMSGMSSKCEGNAEDRADSESKQNRTDMEDQMKKYFRHLWKRNIEKLKGKSTKVKTKITRDKDLRSSKTKQHSEDSKLEPSRSKANLQKVSKNTTTKGTINKIAYGSEKYNDYKRMLIAEYSKKSKSETKSSLSVGAKNSIKDREVSPVAIKRCTGFQRFIRHSDDRENKHNNSYQNKTENLHKKIRTNLDETITKSTKKTSITKKNAECKQSVKTEQQSKVNTNLNNAERVNFIKSVVRVNNRSPSQCINGENDLRSKLSRKRTRSECFAHSQRTPENKLDRENLVITVKQEAKGDPKISASLAPIVNKPKAKKCKKIKLVINIECPDSDSDDYDQNFNECCASPQDLSFLDDFNVDEIVDSLSTSHSQGENHKIIATGDSKSQIINKANENNNTCNEETKPKSLINDTNLKAIKIKKDANYHKQQVILINSNAEDRGSIKNTKSCKEEQIMKRHTKNETNIKQESNNNMITDLTGKSYEKNAQVETMDLCNSNDSVLDITDENKTVKPSEPNRGKSDNDRKFQLLTKSNRPSVKKILGSESAIKKPFKTATASGHRITKVSKTKLSCKHKNTTQKPLVTIEDAFETKVKENFDPSTLDKTAKKEKTHSKISEDSIEVSLETMFNNIEQNNNNNKRDINKKLNDLDKHVKKEKVISLNSEDPVEASLQNMFNNIEQNSSIKINSEAINKSDKLLKKENLMLQKYRDAVEASLETMFNGIKKKADINMDIKQSNLSATYINKEIETLEIALKTIEVPPEIMIGVDQNTKNSKINRSNQADKHLKIDTILQETMDNSIKQKVHLKINSEPSNVSKDNIKGIRSKISGRSSRKSLKTEKNMLGKKPDNKIDIIPPCRSDKNAKDTTEHLLPSKDIVKKPLEKPINNKEKKNKHNIITVVPPQPSHKHIQEKTASRLFSPENSNKKTLGTLKSPVEPASSQMDIKPQSDFNQHNKAKEKHLHKPKETVKIPLEATIKNVEKKSDTKISIKPINKRDENIKENSEHVKISNDIKTVKTVEERVDNTSNKNIRVIPKHLQKSKDIIKKSTDTTINYAEKNVNITMDTLSNKSDKNIKEKSENCLRKSENTTKQNLVVKINDREQKNSDSESNNTSEKNVKEKEENCLRKSENTTKQNLVVKINNSDQKNSDSESKNTSEKNYKEKEENCLQKSEDTTKQSCVEKINNSEQENISSVSNITDKNIEENILPSQCSEVISEKLLETDNNNIQHQINVTTKDELLINVDKNIEDTSEQNSIATNEKSLKANNKEFTKTSTSNVEESQTKAIETLENNTQKPETKDDDLSKTKDANIKLINKDSASTKSADITRNSNVEQEPVDSNKNIVPNGRKYIDFKERQLETKSNEVEVKWSKEKVPPFVPVLQARMFDRLHQKYTVTSIIRYGRFSSIYKCEDFKGKAYAVKALNPRFSCKGQLIEEILLQLQNNTADSYLMNTCIVQERYCLLTEYYPKNLKQALDENKRGFHIDVVQILSRQLVEAVNMLTNFNIIHSDIKPTHILLNSQCDRLKVCGFERSGYSNELNIIPSTGSTNYRAPEIILGFSEDDRIDVWSTALVMFEMVTNTQLFPGTFNNEILYQQISTIGCLDWSIMESARYWNTHFYGTSFILQMGGKRRNYLPSIPRSKSIRKRLFASYIKDWAQSRTKWEMTKDADKVDTLNKLLEQMLVLDPRYRLPIQFVGASEFLHDVV